MSFLSEMPHVHLKRYYCSPSRDRSRTRRHEAPSRGAASGLRSLGIKKGDRVLIFVPNSIDFVLAMFASFELGAIAACSKEKAPVKRNCSPTADQS